MVGRHARSTRVSGICASLKLEGARHRRHPCPIGPGLHPSCRHTRTVVPVSEGRSAGLPSLVRQSVRALQVRGQPRTPAGPVGHQRPIRVALVKVAGQVTLHSRAFDCLTALSRDIGTRATGSRTGSPPPRDIHPPGATAARRVGSPRTSHAGAMRHGVGIRGPHARSPMLAAWHVSWCLGRGRRRILVRAKR